MEIFDTVTASETGTWVHLVNQQTGQPAYLGDDESKPCRIRVLGPDSPTYKRLAADRMARNVKENHGSDIKKMSHNQIVALIDKGAVNKAEDAADATIAWENLPLPEALSEFSVENAAKVYTDYPQVLANVDAVRANTADFFEQG